jgi:2-polyprenyl-6-methoxyphenol hydroxylase-like FAD-dependent oxidoreductase
MVVATPTNDGLTVVTVAWPIQEFERVRNDVDGTFFADIERFVPQFYERLKAGTQEERFYGTGVLPNFFRKPFGPGWALVGDAGYHKDPFTAQGITNSFQSAEMLANALDNAWSGKLSMESALSGYETERNRRALPLYQHTLQLASFTPLAPEIQQFLFAIRNNQVETDRFFGVLAGSVDVQDFFSAKNVRKTLGAAGWQFAA